MPGMIEVEDGHVVAPGFGALQRILGVGGRVDVESAFAEGVGDDLEERAVVVDDQDAGRGWSH